MKFLGLLLSLAANSIATDAKPANGAAKLVFLPLHRHWEPVADDALQSLPLTANGVESLVYTVEVQFGGMLTLINWKRIHFLHIQSDTEGFKSQFPFFLEAF